MPIAGITKRRKFLPVGHFLPKKLGTFLCLLQAMSALCEISKDEQEYPFSVGASGPHLVP
jgi:hypothetical protein